jgi:2-dehydro-3-deoxyphosphogluconate aldolase/(4S)-4-hydroxy-2-oxoglutarate aldolase
MNEKDIIAVVRFDDKQTSLDFSNACIQGGINLLEVIAIRSNSFEIISELSNIEDVIIGAGTVLNVVSAERAYNAGAKFIVSPHTDKKIINFTKSKGLISIAGAYTSSEIVNAYNLGADYVKIFPASSGGPAYVKAIKEALPFVKILVTGGINLQNSQDFISAGASLIGVSTALTGKGVNFDKDVVLKNSKNLLSSINKKK